MTGVAERAGTPFTARVLAWRDLDGRTHVATAHGRVVGVVDRTGDGHFVSRDADATPIGRYSSLRAAQLSLLSTTASGRPARRAALGERVRGAAVATGALAGALALTAGALTPFI